MRAFLRQRLGIGLRDGDDEIEDGLPVELDGLRALGRSGSGCSRRGCAGVDQRTAIEAEIARGTLPPGVLGKPVIDDVSPIVAGIVRRAHAAPRRRRPAGATRSTCASSSTTAACSAARSPASAATCCWPPPSRASAAKHRIAAWVRLLALTASAPERPFASATVGRGQGRGDVRTAWIAPLGDDAAARLANGEAELAVLIDLYDRGMREPLPIYARRRPPTPQAWRRRAGRPVLPRARSGRPSWNFEKEDREPEHELVLGGVRTLAELLDERARGPTRPARAGSRRAVALRALRPPPVGRPAGPRGGGAPDERPARAPAQFDVCGPLPRGVTVLEASAGTGKTYAIAALAARYVADGIPLERLLLVTFTRMATGELRERVRERFVSVERGLARRLAGAPAPDGDDPVVDAARRRRDAEVVEGGATWLAQALADFDAATIATTHGFCQEVLGGLGIAADLEPNVEFVEDLDDLVGEVVDDLYVRRFFRSGWAAFDRAEAGEIVRMAVDNPTAPDRAARRSRRAFRSRDAPAPRRRRARRPRAAQAGDAR